MTSPPRTVDAAGSTDPGRPTDSGQSTDVGQSADVGQSGGPGASPAPQAGVAGQGPSPDTVGAGTEDEAGTTAVSAGDPATPEPAAQPVPPDGPGAAAPLSDDALVEVLRAMQRDLAAGNERAAARERVIDRLHDENQRLRAGERQGLLRPVVTDLQRLRDDLLTQAGALPGDFTGEQAADLLRSYAHSVALTLERAGVVPVRPHVGEAFDSRLHRASGTVEAAEPAADATIAAILRDGYRDTVSDRILSPATVRVARWTPPAHPDPPAVRPL